MGEYATYRDESIKIGMCENMYFLRFDQRHQVHPEPGNANPVTEASQLRFRFPWPDEDHIKPGANAFYKNGYHRGERVEGFTPPADVEHGSVQFSNHDSGYLVSLPCPESNAYDASRRLRTCPDVRIGLNGYNGAVHLVAQKPVLMVGLVPILRCGGCGAMWQEQEWSRIKELAVCFRREGDRRIGIGNVNEPPAHSRVQFYHAIADRLLAGLRGLTAADLAFAGPVTMSAVARRRSHKPPTPGDEAA